MVYGGHRNKIWWKLGGKQGGGRRCCCQRSDVRVEGRMSGLGPDVRALRAGCPGSRSGDERDEHRVGRLNPGEIRRNLWMEIGGKGWEARSTQNKANPRIQTNKISTHQQITKKIGAIFGGEFSN